MQALEDIAPLQMAMNELVAILERSTVSDLLKDDLIRDIRYVTEQAALPEKPAAAVLDVMAGISGSFLGFVDSPTIMQAFACWKNQVGARLVHK